MNEFEKSLFALEKKGRLRSKKFLPKNVIDFASNDYLGFKKDAKSFEKAVKSAQKHGVFAPSASQLVYGYQEPHKRLENTLKKLHAFEDAIIVGSGFLANSALVSALPSHHDLILMDEEYHASGIAALALSKAPYQLFLHNNPQDLQEKLRNSDAKRVFVFVESVYSMIGDILPLKIIELADKYDAYLVIDEAHGYGVIGGNLGGVYDYYGITPKPKHIKMGTLSKAIGGYGAYILAQKEVISFLVNRAKQIIYSTALSPIDALIANERVKKISKNSFALRKKLDRRLLICEDILEKKIYTPIIMLESKNAENIHKKLVKMNIITGFIRPPTTPKASIRLIARLGETEENLIKTLKMIKSLA
ncbi:MAG TPA: pyridoxal phosphate-dependent aminotransferase family protein [Campylobacterales bacterium]|nr:pyridoxal phosphate-dependent aminotransferase family protein [Campylobacterales bacterium]